MVNKEECISAINKFIESKSIEDAVTLFKYLCELKETNQPEVVKKVCENPALISSLLPQTVNNLIAHFNINKITDKNNNLITVY